MRPPFLGLALGGGGARGAAHIGVLHVLHEHKIIPEHLAGTSAGAVIGAMYAATLDPAWMESRFREFLMNETTKFRASTELMNDRNPETLLEKATKKIRDHFAVILGVNRSYIIKRDVIDEMLEFLLPVRTFEELQIPLKVVATDIQTSSDHIYESGNLIEAVARSCSIPGFIKPTRDGDAMLVDGGVTNPLPISTLRDECDFVLAVNIDRGSLPQLRSPNMVEIMKRADLITGSRLTTAIIKEADFLITPEVLGLHWSDYGHFDTLVENGRQAAEGNLQELRSKINRKSNVFYKLKQWLG